MFRSIRWRLVLSYVLLTLLTVAVMGGLALSLVRRYAGQQADTVLALPASLRRLMLNALDELLEREAADPP